MDNPFNNPIFFLLLGASAILLLLQWLHNRRPTYSATATIVSRRVEPGRTVRSHSSSGYKHTLSTLNYIVTFRLSDGEKIELFTGESEYHILEEGLTGHLQWQGTDFRYFESQED